MHDVVIVGGGVIGLSIARESAANGHSVLVLERGETGEGASWAAAGMLAPQSEAEQRGPLFDLCAASHRLYREWVHQLQDQSGVDLEYVESGLLFLAQTDIDLDALRQRTAWHRGAGMKFEALSAEEAKKLEPAITMPLAGAILMPDEHHITPRKLAAGLRAACTVSKPGKIEIRTGKQVEEIVTDGQRVTGVRVGQDVIAASTVVIASGAWTPAIKGLQPQIPVSPRKGQILSLGMPGPGVFGRIIRWGRTYAVPRPNGDLIVGATNEDVGFDRSLTPSGIGQLLTAAQALSNAAAGFPIQEMWTGLRPSTPDGLPVLGRSALSGLIYSTGHYRNGVLLAPITAEIITALIENRPPPMPLEAFAPTRFAV